MDTFISPNHRGDPSTPRTIEDEIDIFESQVDGWLFAHVRALTDIGYAGRENAGFALLTLLVTYFEAIEGYRRGATGKSPEYFVAGLQWVLPEMSSVPASALGSLYDQLRCGLYHQGGPKGKVSITHSAKAVELYISPSSTLENAVIDPWLLFASIETHFRCYIASLRDGSQKTLRTAFEVFRAVRRAEISAMTLPPNGAVSSFS
jgi:hypothetical protein